MANNRVCTNCEVSKENSKKVTSVGNSWIICRSKSHSGRIYYFNTLTGEAVWNLSDEEIEKAKKTTKIFQRRGNNLDSCPEPKDPPIDTVHQCQNTHGPQQLHPELIINQQIPKQSCVIPPYISSQCVKCFSVNSLAPLAINMRNNSTFNPNIWSVSSNPQIIFGPSESSSLDSNQTTVNFPFGNVEKHLFVQNTSVPLNRRFHSMRPNNFIDEHNHRTIHKKSPNLRYNNRNGSVQKSFIFNDFDKSTKPRDLRQLLCAKRNLNRDKPPENCTVNQDEAESNQNGYNNMSNVTDFNQIQIIKPKIEDICPSDVDDIWLKEHAFVQGTQLKLNIEPLKKYIIKDICSSNWFIVADFNALLDHYNFINVIANSDGKCQLMVPDNTLAELQIASRSDDISVMNRAHYVLWLLSQQFTSGRAVMGKESEESKSENIYDFTLKLSEQNRNVVLISNIITASKYKNTNILPVFAIQDIKEILEKPCADLSMKTQAPNVDSNITVIIPNGRTKTPTCVSHDTQCNLYLELDNEVNNLRKRKESSSNTHIIYTSDIGIQTDSVPDERNIACKEVQTDTLEQIIFHENDPQNCVHNDSSLNETPKKKEIRLKRNLIYQSSNNTDSEINIDKRQFKWRKRKRNLPSVEIHDHVMDCEDANQINVDLSNSDQLNDCNTHHNRNDSKIMSTTDETRSTPDNSFSENTISTCPVYINNNQQNVTIEETSTSGVISNSVSNDDTESERSIRQRERIHINYEPKEKSPSKCVMFEIDSSVMEESLITRSDEWVSRFVQIMEEVLTEILQLDPPFSNASLPPPWTLHEAAECIKKKFSYDYDVTEAASRLTSVLYKISDDRGKLNTHLEPSEFMEMYSYAIFLVDSLQTLLSNCEDIQIAADSLAKLLSDIQNPISDSVYNDTFQDCIEDLSANVSQSSCANSPEKESNSDINEVQSFLQKETPKGWPDNEVQSVSQKETPEKRTNNVVRSVSQKNTPEKWPDIEIRSISQKKTPEKCPGNKVRSVSQKKTTEEWREKEVQSVSTKETPEKWTDNEVRCVSQQNTPEKCSDNEVRSILTKKTTVQWSDNKIRSNYEKETPEKWSDNELQSIPQKNTLDTYSVSEIESVSQKTPEKQPDDTISRTYSLRSAQKKTAEKQVEEKPQSVQFIRNINVEDSFFSSLKLTRRQGDATIINDVDTVVNGPLYLKDLISTNESADDSTNAIEPKIIRNFTKCLEFENRLKFNQREILDMDSLDYSEEDDYECYDEDNNYDYEYYQDDQENCYEITEDVDLDKSGLKWIFAKFMKEVQEAFSRVYNFCEKTREEMKESLCSSRKLEIHDLAQTTRTHIHNVHNDLMSIQIREENEGNNNINTILNEAGFYLDFETPTDYRELIEKYIVQAKILMESVNIIVEALK